ncbi:hypothetical protein ASZ90_019750 [hydrocarbon metagenome]|uniref:Uncharacterized protein n=1 Tax=hydrocarbon metagenome TaxID=938273 RepID=A0A0W8E2M5_9ZZZZ
MVLYMIIGAVDIIVVGRLGAAPLAAAGLGAEVSFMAGLEWLRSIVFAILYKKR